MRHLRIGRELAPAVGLGAALVAFGIAAIGAPIVLGQDSVSAGDGQGPATTRAVVASGSSQRFGRWEIVSSQTAAGDPCVGVRLLDGPGGGGRSLAEACGPTVANQVGSIVAPPGGQGTLFFGRVDDRATTAHISHRGSEMLSVMVRSGADGHQYVTAESAERLPAAQVRLSDAASMDLGRADPAAIGG